MNQYGVLVYGAGNCEIAASLQEQLQILGEVEEDNIFARGYLFGNSCLAMYKRFHKLKEEIDSVKAGGVYEYLRTDTEKVETMELQMRQACIQEEFESFLHTGLEKIRTSEIVLILIGQSNEEGMFIDLCGEAPMYMPYQQVLQSISEIAGEKGRSIRLILDIPQWHAIKMPYLISRYHQIKEVFVYERKQTIDILPLRAYIENLRQGKNEHCIEEKGYWIDTHSLWWDLCKWKWERYLEVPSTKKWKEFYGAYRKLVRYNGNKHRYYQTLGSRIEFITTEVKLSKQQLKEYFRACGMENVAYEEIHSWLKEMKSCIDYYKL